MEERGSSVALPCCNMSYFYYLFQTRTRDLSHKTHVRTYLYNRAALNVFEAMFSYVASKTERVYPLQMNIKGGKTKCRGKKTRSIEATLP